MRTERERNLKVRKLMKGKLPGTQENKYTKRTCAHIQIMFPDTNSRNRTVTESSSQIIHPMKSTKVQNPWCILHNILYANVHARKLATPRIVAVCVGLSVLTPTQTSGISRHCFGQGRMLLRIVGYPLTLRCASSGEY